MTTLHQAATTFLTERHLDPEVAAQLGVHSELEHGIEWLVFPVLLGGKTVNRKYRRIDEKEFRQDKGGAKLPWNYGCLLDETLSHLPLIVTEGELDAIACIQTGHIRTISVPDGAPAQPVDDVDTGAKFSWVPDVEKLVEDTKQIIIAVDNDAPGWALRDALVRRFKATRCKWIKYPEACKDPNDILRKLGPDILREYIRDAEFIPITGVYLYRDLPPEPDREIVSTGIDELDPHWKIRKGEVCVITGIPGMGKTTLINDVVFRLAKQQNYRIAYGSFEQPPKREFRRQAAKWLYDRDKLADDEWRQVDNFLDDRFLFFMEDIHDEKAMDIEWLLERNQVAALRHEADVSVVDPWNEIDHVWNGYEENETLYTGRVLKLLRRQADQLGIALIIVAHPRKVPTDTKGKFNIPSLYDISGSSNWANKPDVGIVVHRDKGQTLVDVRKVRFQPDIGTPGSVWLKYNALTAKFGAGVNPKELN